MARKTKEFRGVLDWIDLLMGRFSSRTSEDGTRIRSWGVTYNFWMTFPSMIFLLIYGVAILVVATSTRNHVPRKLVKLYVGCVQKAEAASKPTSTCKIPKAESGTKLTAKMLDLGKWPFMLAMFFPLLGFLGMTLRNKDDFGALRDLLDTAKGFVTKEQKIPDSIWEGIKSQLSKVTGASVTDSPAPPLTPKPKAPPPGMGGPPPGAVDDAGN